MSSADPADPAAPVAPGTDPAGRLSAQIGFLLDVDRLKSVLRRGYLADGSRRENTGEHSWTLALMAIVLAEHAAEPVDVATVVRMVVLHDLVEVDAGDTYVYDEAGRATKEAREQAAAERIYGLLPADQGAELRAVWDDFEHGTSAEARFARTVDRFAGFLLNHASSGIAWLEHGITADQVHRVNEMIGDGSPALWGEVQARITDAVERGWLRTGDAEPAEPREAVGADPAADAGQA